MVRTTPRNPSSSSRTTSTSSTSSTSATSTGGGGSGLFDAVRAHNGRALIDQLREIGLDQYIELPQIAVMGDTSSGKSSLLSALSGVSFPSSDELTTRCPTQLLLSYGPTFRGRVKLHRFHSNHSEHESEIASMSDVPLAITRLTQLLVDEGQHISDDSIVIELCGPKLANLTLTDLPGLVRTVSDGEDPSIIPRIRDMVDRYMKQTRTIIIAIVPANVDVHNSEILQNAMAIDPDGVRTIGVVTKLDLVDAGAERAVHELLRNHKKRMTLGYHAVKCRSQKDLNEHVTIDLGKDREKQFFRTHEYWCKLSPLLWGVDELTKKLVLILDDNIRRALPAVVKEISELMAQTQNELHGLGSSFDSPAVRRRMFCEWVGRFVRPMEAVLKGDYDTLQATTMVDEATDVDIRLRAQIRQQEEIFQAKIMATKDHMPGLVGGGGGGEAVAVAVGDIVVVSTADADGRERVCQVTQVGEKGDIQCSEFSGEWLGTSRYTPHRLNALRRYMVANRGDEIAIFPPYSVFCSILRQWIDTWEPPTMELVKQYQKRTLGVAMRLVDELNAAPRVTQYMKNRATAALEMLRDKAEQEIQKLLACQRRAYTQDDALVTLYTHMLRPKLEKLLTQRLLVQANGQVAFADVVNVLTDLSRSSEEHDMVVMDCGLRAYFQLAVTRYVDVVPMLLNDLMLRGFVNTMAEELSGTTDDTLDHFLTESEYTRTRRVELAAKFDTLKEAKCQIEGM